MKKTTPLEAMKQALELAEDYVPGQSRILYKAWQAISEMEKVEPVAWMHNLPGRFDVIHTDVKNLLARQAVESHQGFHRPLDKTEHYTIPLYAHAKPCARCEELQQDLQTTADALGHIQRQFEAVNQDRDDWITCHAKIFRELQDAKATIAQQAKRIKELESKLTLLSLEDNSK